MTGIVFLAILMAIMAMCLESEWMNEHKDEFLEDEELDELK